MLRVALKMLFGDRAKFLGIVLGVTLAALVIAQQGGIFLGFMKRATGAIADTPQADLWILDRNTEFLDDISKLRETTLHVIRGIEGVEWAVPMHRGIGRVRLSNGRFRYVNLIGIDDNSLIGGPVRVVGGSIMDLFRSDAVIVDRPSTHGLLAIPDASRPGGIRPLRVGDTLELNDRRAVVVGLSEGTPTINDFPMVYTTFRRAVSYVPLERKQLTFVLAKLAPGADVERVRRLIAERTGLSAYTGDQFMDLTLAFYLRHGHVIVIFGFVVLLGVVIGALITGFLFFNFIADNLRHFAMLKAMGATDALLGWMLMTQALVVSLLGTGLGLGSAAGIGTALGETIIPFSMPWQLAVGAGLSVVLICTLTATLCLQRLAALDPASVFKA
jgi:putative ABC transport system permease protein